MFLFVIVVSQSVVSFLALWFLFSKKQKDGLLFFSKLWLCVAELCGEILLY